MGGSLSQGHCLPSLIALLTLLSLGSSLHPHPHSFRYHSIPSVPSHLIPLPPLSLYCPLLFQTLRLLGALCGAATIVCAAFSFIALGFLNPRGVIADTYLIIFGVIMIIAELRWVTLLRYVYFLQHYLGLGMFYIFVGGLILGDSWWMILVAIVLLAVGIVYLMLGCACRRMVPRPILPSRTGEGGNVGGYAGDGMSGGGMSSDDPRWEMSQKGTSFSADGPGGYGGGGAAYGGGGAAYGGGPAYGGFTPAFAAGGAGGGGGGAGGWGLTPQSALGAMQTAQGMGLTANHVVQGVQTAQGMGLTAGHVVQGAQIANKYSGAYGGEL